jgi:5,10-methylene-tetrahydrofolate dehydrogenase/methenyl tetrahydrofolate cyclohydrolase
MLHAVKDKDAVFSALGRGHSFKSENLITNAVSILIGTMKEKNVRRLKFLSASLSWRQL